MCAGRETVDYGCLFTAAQYVEKRKARPWQRDNINVCVGGEFSGQDPGHSDAGAVVTGDVVAKADNNVSGGSRWKLGRDG